MTDPKNQSVKNLSVYPQQTDRSRLYSGKNLTNLLLVETGPWENVRAVEILRLSVINVFTGIKLLPQKKFSAVNRCITSRDLLSLVFFCYFHKLVLTLCVFADVKQRTTGMHCQMEALVYLTGPNIGRQGLKLWLESPGLVSAGLQRAGKD